TATYIIKTNLSASKSPVPVVKPVIPDAIKTTNKKPVAIAPENIYVKPGESFTIDGSKSYDPEGQPLIYRWIGFEESFWAYPPFDTSAVRKCTAPMRPGEYTYDFYVLDGLRYSQPVHIKVHVRDSNTTSED
ncbi:MAG TPA: hypothetical protein PLP86_06005, partial [Armatimonadota bacterium]|nr:hypothetical protein [Armatimonadota bacterium]